MVEEDKTKLNCDEAATVDIPDGTQINSISALVRNRNEEYVEESKERIQNNGDSIEVTPSSEILVKNDYATDSSSDEGNSGGKTKKRFQNVGNHLKEATTIKTKEIEVVVHLLDGSKKVLICPNGKFTVAAEICNRMSQICGLRPESRPFFSLWLSESALELPLKPYYEPFMCLKQWPQLSKRLTKRPSKDLPTPRFEYRRNPFVTKIVEQGIDDPCAIKLFYDQCRTLNMTSMYPIKEVDACQLAGLDMQLIFGDHEDRIYAPDFLTENAIMELIPSTLYPKYTESRWRELIEQAHLHHKGKTDPQIIQKLYLQYCINFEYYGCSFFYGRVCFDVANTRSRGAVPTDFGDIMRFGINYDGIFIINHYTNELLMKFDFYEIAWDICEANNTFYIEYGDLTQPNSLLFITAQAEVIEAVMLRFMEMRVENEKITG